jgi:chromosome segregation ATPase
MEIYDVIIDNLEEVDCVRKNLAETSDSKEEDVKPQRYGLASQKAHVKDLEKEIDEAETHVEPCGGTDGKYAEEYMGYNYTVSHTIWNGDVTFQRDISAYD